MKILLCKYTQELLRKTLTISKLHFTLIVAVSAFVLAACSQTPENACAAGQQDSPFKTEYLTPARIVCSGGSVRDESVLLQPFADGQVSTSGGDPCVLRTGGWVLLDFGRELQGGIRIARGMNANSGAARFRLVLGESVSEALSDINDPETTATNDHSVRDFEVSVPWLGTVEVGNSGFRFARLELLDYPDEVDIMAVQAISRLRDLPYLGSFRCSDERLNQIWQTGAYTVHLCMQDYLWDGIKRDRLVWIGDMHPEVMTIGTVFGDQEVVRRSLDFVREQTPASDWMNGICSYSLWWLIIHHQLYRWYGDIDYLKAQQPYMTELLRHVMASMDGNRENYQEGRFIDWPTNDKPEVIHAGLQGITVRALDCGAQMAEALGDKALQQECLAKAQELRTYVPDTAGNGQAAAHLSIAGMLDASEAARIILEGGPGQCTSFMGYYLLEALAGAGRYAEAMELISTYWGRMLDLGATTFWEDFNYNDSMNAARIDEVVPNGKFDIHADGGAWCYVGLRHSFCHGWASGPTAWLSRHVLGIEPVEAGFGKVRIEPHLGALDWAEGSFPTPYGVIEVRHEKLADGSVKSQVKLPKGMRKM